MPSPFDRLPQDKQDAAIACIEEMFKASERRSRDVSNAISDAREIGDDNRARKMDALIDAMQVIQHADHRYIGSMSEETKQMFVQISGKPWDELEACMDGEGGFWRAVGYGFADGADGEEFGEVDETTDETEASGQSDIPGIDLSRVAEHEDVHAAPDPSGLDAGDLVKYRNGTDGRQGMLISHPQDGKAQVRWFGDDAPTEPRDEIVADLEIAEQKE